ncbi:MAG: hypothetical protein NT029_08330 [Armatimonadetes bacterium]|nr:hypothetical protein [Armatimonadota bacterium]
MGYYSEGDIPIPPTPVPEGDHSRTLRFAVLGGIALQPSARGRRSRTMAAAEVRGQVSRPVVTRLVGGTAVCRYSVLEPAVGSGVAPTIEVMTQTADNVRWSEALGCDAAEWTAEQQIASSDDGAAFGVKHRHGAGVLYSKSGAVKWLSTADPFAWSGSGSSIGFSGAARGLVCTRSNLLVGALYHASAAVGARWSAVRSMDGGSTWSQSFPSKQPDASAGCALAAIGDVVVWVYSSANGALHLVSTDGGATWS